MRVLVVYDVNTESATGRGRLRRVAKACEGFGQRVQKSVFECDLKEANYEKLRHDLLHILDDSEDDLRIYRLPEITKVEHFGVNAQVDFRKPLII
jgi:CRISPR-associated protein Cas2